MVTLSLVRLSLVLLLSSACQLVHDVNNSTILQVVDCLWSYDLS